MTAPMAPEELAAIEGRALFAEKAQPEDCVGVWVEPSVSRADAVRLLAEVRRLQAENAEVDDLRATLRQLDITFAEHSAGQEVVIKRLQAERDAAPPVGQTVEEAIDAHVRAHRNYPTIGDLIPDGMPSSISAARLALLRAITARDAEVARAAAEREWTLVEALQGLLDHDYADQCQECGISHSEAWTKAKAALVAPAPAGQPQTLLKQLLDEQLEGGS